MVDDEKELKQYCVWTEDTGGKTEKSGNMDVFSVKTNLCTNTEVHKKREKILITIITNNISSFKVF